MKHFALIMTHHRLWGTILLPYMIVSEVNKHYFRMAECLSPDPDPATVNILSAEERETVKLISDYSNRNLYRLFSKNISVKEFLEEVSPEKINEIIRPYIERKMHKSLLISRDEAIPVYLQKEKMDSLHPEDRLILSGEHVQPVFRFDRKSGHSTYNLSLDKGGETITLLNSGAEIICVSPCILRENRNLYFVSDIEGFKLKPFFTKEYIIIPETTEKKYFAGFVLTAVNNFKVEGSGFEISERQPEKEALLTLESGIRGIPVLLLSYRYDDRVIFASEQSASFTTFKEDNGRYIFLRTHRDFEWERKCNGILEELGFFSDDDVNFCLESPSGKPAKDLYALIEAVNLCYNDLLDYGFRIVPGSVDRRYNLRHVSLEISHQVIDDWFDLKATVIVGDWKIPFIRLRKNILEGIREFILPDGEVAVLPETWFAKYKNILEFGKVSGETLKMHKKHFSLLSDALGEEENISESYLQKLLMPSQAIDINPPPGLKGEMRHYQVEGLNWLQRLQSSKLGGCLADDMGLGKTLQALALLQYNKENLKPEIKITESEIPLLFDTISERFTSLIIVPATLLYNWENEIKSYVPDMMVYCHKGNQRKRTTLHFIHYDIILSSYHTVRQDIDIISAFRFHYIILDESQVIKNPGSMIYKTMTRLNSEFKLVLTGTPVENSLTDLWTQLNFVNPGLLGNLAFFRREFVIPIEKNGDDDKEGKLKKIIKPFILRRTKEMVAGDLPPVSEQTVFCDMTEEQMKIYDREKSAIRNSILKNIENPGSEKSAIIILQGLMKLRQISNHPVLAFEDYSYGSGKFERVLQDMENIVAEGHKILVFSSFVKHLELYAEILKKNRKKFSLLTGASIDREKIVNSFQNEPLNKIFLISMKAGGTGLNLTAADYVFILDPWWNPAVEMQAMNRAHRIGQDKNVFVYRYISGESIEEKIVRLQGKKAKLAETFIRSNNPLKEIDFAQILDILD
jgi:superfamily II DNA or RNA helicase